MKASFGRWSQAWRAAARRASLFNGVSVSSGATAALCTRQRHFSSSNAIPEEEVRWTLAMEEKYGPGTFLLFRSLYKDMCDEMRREYYTKPPPPLPLPTADAAVAHRAAHQEEGETETEDVTRDTVPSSSASAEGSAEGQTAAPGGGGEKTAGASSATPARPVETFGDGSWRVEYQTVRNTVVFSRDAVAATAQGRVVAFAKVELKDPPKKNAVLTFLDWFPIEVLVERKGVVVHFSMACSEGAMHMRNARVYDAVANPWVMDCSDDADWARHNLLYDGPCLWHLELSFQNELYDTMQDHGVTLDWIRWAAEWVFYLEHVCFTRWSLGMLDTLIAPAERGPEDDFLLPVERAILDEPAEDWLAARAT